MRIETFRARLQDLGAKPCHEDRLMRAWLQRLALDGGPRPQQHFLPLAVRAALPALKAEFDALARLRSQHPGEDGSSRLLVELADGQTVESVLLPRDGLCVSTQVGCAVGCVFCMTGKDGLLRQLGSAEIVAQVALARSLRRVHKVVFMGMGEPAHNLDNVVEAIETLGMYQVLTRFIFGQPSTWSEIAIRLVIIWMVMFGVVVAFREGAQVSVDLMYRLSGRYQRPLHCLITLISVLFLGVIIWYGIDIAWRVRFQEIAGLEFLPMSIGYAALPVGATFAIIAVIANYLDPRHSELDTQQ